VKERDIARATELGARFGVEERAQDVEAVRAEGIHTISR
jgi:hypothetical protein